MDPSACRSCQCCQKKKGSSKVYGWICSVWPSWVWKSQQFLLGTLSLGLWVIAVDPAFIAGHQSIKNCGIWIGQLDHLSAVMITSFFLIFSEHSWDKLCSNLPHLQFFANNCAYSSHTDIKLCTYCLYTYTRQSLSMKFFIWPINSGVLTSLLLPHLSSSLTDTLPSLNLLCHSKTEVPFMQDAPKAISRIPYISVAFLLSLKLNSIVYRSSKVSSCPDCISQIHQLWQSGFSWVFSNSSCSFSFESEIIKIGQSSYNMESNNILNFQKSTTILDACTKIVWKLIEGTSYICIYIYCNKKETQTWLNYHYLFRWRILLYSPSHQMTALFLNQYLNFKESSPLHKSPRHIKLLTTEINIIISNKNHPASISLLLSWVEALVAPSHDDLNLLLCLNLNTSSFHLFNSSLRSLKLNILFFTSIHKLHLSLIAVYTLYMWVLLYKRGWKKYITIALHRAFL